jgi:nickel/cobalt transporter (NicO) family protein
VTRHGAARLVAARRGACVAVLAVFVLAGNLRAHRLDEYLQAARLSLTQQRVMLELDLTPGVAVAAGIIALLDRDGDASITPVEARAYADLALSETAVTLDGHRVTMALDSVEVPTSQELRDGVGTIQLRAGGPVAGLAPGRHDLQFRNDHRPEHGVYLVNALKPEDGGLQVVSQRRDPSQREARIEYAVGSTWRVRALWLLAGVATIALLVVRRRG